MTVPEERLKMVVEILRGFGARRVLLFGSYARDPEHARDLDLAVEGIPLNTVVAADVAAERVLDVPLDLVSMEENPEFFCIVSKERRVLYEEGSPR
ncbi:MAG: nucleotidyltransferase domain-containing protein [Deltaproteobacteria bacterium]|nr:nucleotidyltransferase domain-containing protein [Deltaproteobacteria bacterium]